MFGKLFAWMGQLAEWCRALVPGEFMLGISYVDLIHCAAGLLTLGVLAICIKVADKKERRLGKGYGISDWRYLHMLVTVFATSLLTMALTEHSILASWTMSHLQSQEANFYNYAEWPLLMKMTAWSVLVCAAMSIYLDGFRRKKPALILLTLLEIAMGILIAPLVMVLQIVMSVCNYVLPFKVVIYGFPYLLFLTVFVLCVKEMLDETPEEYRERKIREEENSRLNWRAQRDRDLAAQYRNKAVERREQVRRDEEERRRRPADQAERRRTTAPQYTMAVDEEEAPPAFSMLAKDEMEQDVPEFTMAVQDDDGDEDVPDEDHPDGDEN